MTAWALSEAPLIPRCAACGRIEPQPETHMRLTAGLGRGHEFVAGEPVAGMPALVCVALSAEAAERWRDEPAEGVRREISPVAVIDGERLASGIRRLATPPTRIEDRP